MNNHGQRQFVVSAVALLSLIAGWNISQAEEPSVAGVYSLVEVDGEQLPANGWTEKLDGERCRQVILKSNELAEHACASHRHHRTHHQ